VRFIGLDVHKDFCEVAISEGGSARSAGRVKSTRAELELFAQSLGGDDKVVLEATGNALAIARILEPHVGEVLIANARKLRAICEAKVKNDKVDARTLAELLAAGLVPRVWIPDERTRLLRRLTSRRAQLVRHARRLKSHINATLQRNLTTEVPVSDLFGKRGRAWLSALELPADERQAIESDLRRLDFSVAERELLDREIATIALDSAEIRRLMTIPGVDVVTAATMMAVIGEITRFPSARHLVGYVGLDARVRQSGSAAPRTGRISKEGAREARRVLVEAAWAAQQAPGPLRAFGQRIGARRGKQVAAVAVARKLCVLCWQLLTREQDYAFLRPALLQRKLRRLELRAGAPSQRGSKPSSGAIWAKPSREKREKELALQAELSYRRLVADWQASRPRKGAGAAPGHATHGPSSGQAARQESAPNPAL
jgi:transposase